MREVGLILWAVLPVLPFWIVGSPLAGVGVTWDLLAVAVGVALLFAQRERVGWPVAVALGAGWALALTYSLALAGSRLATDEELPLYDLGLLVRPLVVVGTDFYGPVVYLLAVGVLLLPVLLWAVGAAWVRRVLPLRRPRAMAVVALGLVWLPGSRALGWSFGQDVAVSYRLASVFDAERAARPHDDVKALQLADDPSLRPDVHLYVIESYGTVVPALQGGRAWSNTLQHLDEEARIRGWATASGISTAPVHGGRSWIADASLLTGLHIATQSNYERATAIADRIPTLPSFFAERGYTTVLVRPSDRERPGVRLQNRFGFQRTVFFDDLNYTGPGLGWGHIPDQYTLYAAHRDVIDPEPGPTFAFFHLCTAHLPWAWRPQVVEDPASLLEGEGSREQIIKERKPHQELRIQAKRFTDGTGLRQIDRSPEQSNYVATVIYDLQSIVQQVGSPGDRPRLVMFYGDHQPPFLARGEPATVPVHLMASDPALLEPFLEAGFDPGLKPSDYQGDIEHRDVFGLLGRAAASSR